jgi:hypothetical protein
VEKQYRPLNCLRRFNRCLIWISLWTAIHDNVNVKMIDSINLTTHNIMNKSLLQSK